MEALETTRWQRVHVRVFFQLQMFEKELFAFQNHTTTILQGVTKFTCRCL